MWQRILIRLAFRALDKTFMRWLTHKSQTQRNRIIGLIKDFESYLRRKKTKSATLIADLLTEWSE